MNSPEVAKRTEEPSFINEKAVTIITNHRSRDRSHKFSPVERIVWPGVPTGKRDNYTQTSELLNDNLLDSNVVVQRQLTPELLSKDNTDEDDMLNMLDSLKRVELGRSTRYPSKWLIPTIADGNHISIDPEGLKVTYAIPCKVQNIPTKRIPMVIADRPCPYSISNTIYYEVKILYSPSQAPKAMIGYSSFSSASDNAHDISIMQGCYPSHRSEPPLSKLNSSNHYFNIHPTYWGDVVGCGITEKAMFFTKNGELLSTS